MQLHRVLEVLRLPARLTVEEVGVLLGFHVDSVNFLVDEDLLEVLGAKEGVQRIFAASYINSLRRDIKWLSCREDTPLAASREFEVVETIALLRQPQ